MGFRQTSYEDINRNYIGLWWIEYCTRVLSLKINAILVYLKIDTASHDHMVGHPRCVCVTTD